MARTIYNTISVIWALVTVTKPQVIDWKHTLNNSVSKSMVGSYAFAAELIFHHIYG